MISTLLLSQIIAHLLSDFVLQNTKMCNDKSNKILAGKFIYIHAIIVFASSWACSFNLYFLKFSLIIAISHLLIDVLKECTNKKVLLSRYIFWIDQILHIIVILFVCYFASKNINLSPILKIEEKYLFIIASYLLCMKPSNIIIKKIFEFNLILSDNSENSIEKAGGLIGTIERLIALTFVLVGQYTAIGFIIAAKSILRFKDSDRKQMEYVIIGTLLSFGIAILMGIIYIKLYRS